MNLQQLERAAITPPPSKKSGRQVMPESTLKQLAGLPVADDLEAEAVTPFALQLLPAEIDRISTEAAAFDQAQPELVRVEADLARALTLRRKAPELAQQAQRAAADAFLHPADKALQRQAKEAAVQCDEAESMSAVVPALETRVDGVKDTVGARRGVLVPDRELDAEFDVVQRQDRVLGAAMDSLSLASWRVLRALADARASLDYEGLLKGAEQVPDLDISGHPDDTEPSLGSRAIDQAALARGVRELESRGLITRDRTVGLFALHPLVRSAALARLAKPS